MKRRKIGKYVLAVTVGASLLLPQISTARAETTSQYTVPPKHELRAAWIASVTNIDWPSATGLSVMQQKSEFIKLLDDVEKMGMNSVVVQIKPTADAFYPSQYGPWSKYLTGTQGKDPGYDPLAFMVEEAHKRNIEFHAWFNPYRITMPRTAPGDATLEDLNSLAESHPARKHPEWVIPYGKQLYFDPGIPEAREFIIDGIMEVVKKYDIDAVHLDDYFYPYRIAGKEFPDQATYEKYGEHLFANKDDWRRDNVNQFVKEVHESIKKEKNYVKFGISPFGVWRNIANDPTGSNTTAGQTNYDDLFADTREWINKEYVDYITPQIYWNIGFEPASYDILANWWTKEVQGKNVDLYIGQADYKINANNEAWALPDELPNQIALNRSIPEIKGSMHFSIKDLNKNPLGIKDRLSQDVYKTKALIPSMPWIDDQAPKKPKLEAAKKSSEGIKLTINNHSSDKDTAYFVVYRFEGKNKVNIEDARNILTTIRKSDSGKTTYLDTTADPSEDYTYVITAVDRIHNESKESRQFKVKGNKK